jgi:hypothetical protein
MIEPDKTRELPESLTLLLLGLIQQQEQQGHSPVQQQTRTPRRRSPDHPNLPKRRAVSGNAGARREGPLLH